MLFTSDSKNSAKGHRFGTGAVSAVLHALVIGALFGVLHHAPQLSTYRLPGTAQGTRLLSYYSPGSPQTAAANVAVKSKEKPQPTPTPLLHAPVAAPQTAQAPSIQAETGSGTSTQSGLGQGDISIALVKYFPHPAPDLNALPHGTRGDVILNAVIDDRGKIADLTLIKGIGPSVDSEVIATVKQWTFSPAMRNGVAVRSEQELHFHYEHA